LCHDTADLRLARQGGSLRKKEEMMIREILGAAGLVVGLVAFAVALAWLGARLIRSDRTTQRRPVDQTDAGKSGPEN
jgi:hypothetical protein